MKKVLAIFTAGLLLASGLQITVDRHYCGGNLADIKISVTGRLASCGMEQTEPDCPHHPEFSKKCCEDQISFYTLGGSYYPEYFKLTYPVYERDIFPVYVSKLIPGNSFNTDLINWVLPPGDNLKSGLTQPEICVFRI